MSAGRVREVVVSAAPPRNHPASVPPWDDPAVVWMCEAHPGEPFEHDPACPGPGVPFVPHPGPQKVGGACSNCGHEDHEWICKDCGEAVMP